MIPSGLAPVRGPVCGVFAVAIAANRPFCEVYAFARGHLKKPPQWRGRLYRRELLMLLTAHKVLALPAEGYRGYSLVRAVAELDPAGHYIADVTGHFLTVHDGKCYDQAHPLGAPIAGYYCRNKRVKSIMRVLSQKY
jgi:hypothetical protein